MTTLTSLSRVLRVRDAAREKRPLAVLDLAAQREAQQLQSRLADIDARLAELETLIARQSEGTPHWAEYTREQRALRDARRLTEDALRLLVEPPTEAQVRIEQDRARRIEAEFQRQRRGVEEQIAAFERDGDLDQARIYRHQILSGELRRQVEWELR
jgi:hypothetical protein